MINPDTVKTWFDIFRKDDALAEVRILEKNGSKKKTNSGYFTDPKKALDAMTQFDGVGGIYAVLNEIHTGCYSLDQRDKIIPTDTTTSDKDIVRRRWVLIDIDPERPSGINATDQEKAKAFDVIKKIVRFLRSEGFSEPVIADSANGYHAYYSVDLPNDDDHRKLIEAFLKALNALFSSDEAKVDITVYNASRIAKVIGTTSNKGLDTEERPRRISKFIQIPEEIRTTGREFFRKVAEIIEPKAIDARQNRRLYSEFNLDDFIERNNIKVVKRSRFTGGEKIILEECPFDHNHKDAAILKLDSGAVTYKCFHNSCSPYGWKEFRLHFEPDAYTRNDYEEYRDKRRYYESKSRPAPKVVQEDERGKKWQDLAGIRKKSAADIVFIPTGLEQIDYKIGGFGLGEVTVISGNSGAGKTTVLNHFILSAVQRGYKVGAWSGELKDFRFRDWLDQMAAGKAHVRLITRPKDFYVATEYAKERIHEWIGDNFLLYNNEYGSDWNQLKLDIENVVKEKGIQLILLDNLMALDFDGAPSDNDLQTKFIKDIKNMAKSLDIHFVVVCHPRKEAQFQLLRKESIAGTANLTNLADNLLLIHRIGRDFERRAKDFFSKEEVNHFMNFDLIIEIAKNRDFGIVDECVCFYYEKETRRILNNPDDNIEYGWIEKPTEVNFFEPAKAGAMTDEQYAALGSISNEWYNNF